MVLALFPGPYKLVGERKGGEKRERKRVKERGSNSAVWPSPPSC